MRRTTLSCVVAVLVAAQQPAQAAGSWIPTGRLSTGHAQSFSLNLLADGTALVAGGLLGTGPTEATDAVERYDPVAGTWSAAAPLPDRRSRHQGVVLSSGQVLVAGGLIDAVSGPEPTATAFLYDPGGGGWSPTGSMETPRFNFTLTVLADGRALAAGGLGEGRRLNLSTAEIYDPATGRWTATGSMRNARFVHRAELLPDGRVLVAGGSFAGHCDVRQTAEIYDPATGSWRPTAPMMSARSNHLSVVLQDGTVLVAGGWTRPVATCNQDGVLESVSNTAEIFDPVAERWTQTGSLNVGRSATLVFVRLSDGRVLYGGGRTGREGQGTQRTSSSEVYDPVTRSWSLVGQMGSARTGGAAVLLRDARVLAVAGSPEPRSAELFEP